MDVVRFFLTDSLTAHETTRKAKKHVQQQHPEAARYKI